MRTLIPFLLCGSVFFSNAQAAENTIPTTNAAHQIPALIVGEKEWIYVKALEKNVLARIDSGATTSSIGATEIHTYKKEGKSYVDFKLAHKDWASETLTLPVKRWVEVKQSSSKQVSDSRPVVELDVQLGDYQTKTDFTLTDRSHLRYPVLIGRTFLDKVAMVDVSHRFLHGKVSK